MRKYQEPQMNILELEAEDIITTSMLYESDVTDDNGGGSLGGDEGSDWTGFWQ